MAMALFAAYLSIQRPLQCIVPDERATRQLALRGVSNFAQSSPKFKRAIPRHSNGERGAAVGRKFSSRVSNSFHADMRNLMQDAGT